MLTLDPFYIHSSVVRMSPPKKKNDTNVRLQHFIAVSVSPRVTIDKGLVIQPYVGIGWFYQFAQVEHYPKCVLIRTIGKKASQLGRQNVYD